MLIVALYVRTVLSLRRHKYSAAATSVHEHTPTVSVCIAARNETHALAQCLERVLRSDYEKLEILVLDDSSTDDTSLIIKSFAGAGVRFIPGKPLPAGWLGKNHAYQTLISEASGELLLFIDVDTFIRESTVSKLVHEYQNLGLAMLSVLPRREDPRLSAMLGTLRYYWELLLGTRTSPPASSAIWMVDAAVLTKAGVGLENYGMSVRPEHHMARQVQLTGAYRYIIGTAQLGVTYEKHLTSQYETAKRIYYPMIGRNPLALLAVYIALLLLLLPVGVLLSWRWTETTAAWSIINILGLTAAVSSFSRATYSLQAGRFRLPIVLLLQEFGLFISSAIGHWSGNITWKGRSINASTSRSDALEISE